MRSPKDIATQAQTGFWASSRAAKHLLEEMTEDKDKHFLVPAFIAVVAAGIEGRINTGFIDSFHLKLRRNYHSYVKPYLMMPIRDRLEQLPLVVSDFKYRLNHSSARVKQIKELFELRNGLVHVKQHWYYEPRADTPLSASEQQALRDRFAADPNSAPGTFSIGLPELRRYLRLSDRVVLDWFNIASQLGTPSLIRADGSFRRDLTPAVGYGRVAV